jgi:hypothetical protein
VTWGMFEEQAGEHDWIIESPGVTTKALYLVLILYISLLIF